MVSVSLSLLDTHVFVIEINMLDNILSALSTAPSSRKYRAVDGGVSEGVNKS